MQSGVENSASCTVQCITPSTTAFRGYEVSTGILQRSKVGDAPATYSLTSGAMEKDATTGEYSLPAGCNPFELRSYYKQNSSKNTYYFQWSFLKSEEELGADGDNIDADSDKLPSGWVMPTNTIWETILHGEPKAAVVVNGKQLHGEAYNQGSSHDQHAGAFAFVRIQSGETYYPGILLFRDGMNISCEGLDTEHNKVGTKAKFEDNTLTVAQFNALTSAGCLFLSASGDFSVTYNEWRDKDDGYHFDSNMGSNNRPYFMNFMDNFKINGSSMKSDNTDYYSVRLVKQAYN
jgi:hypothetical protein